MNDQAVSTVQQQSIKIGKETFYADKAFYHGTHRLVPPDQTLQNIWRVAPAVGLTRIADITGLDRIGIPTAVGIRPNAPSLAVSGGKGFTVQAASASAGMEAIEIWHAENVRNNVFLETHANLELSSIVAPMHLLAPTRNSLFDQHQPEPWVMGWDLIRQCEMAVPLLNVSMGNSDYRRNMRWLPFASGSNGLAGGNHLLEALAAALYELIERDAIACSAISGSITDKRVDLKSTSDPLVCSLLDQFEAASINVYLYDCTVDTNIPTYMAAIEDRLDITMGLYKGYGAHLDPAIAMIRALTEAAQARLLLIAGSRDDYFSRDQKINRNMSSNRVESFALPETITANAHSSQATKSFGGDINVILDHIREVGLDSAIVVNLTHEDLGIPVVRVIVPGLEGYMFDHYQPGWRAKTYRTRLETVK